MWNIANHWKRYKYNESSQVIGNDAHEEGRSEVLETNSRIASRTMYTKRPWKRIGSLKT